MSAGGKYIIPHNATETERLDFQHKVLTRTFRGLHRAPLDKAKVRRALDIGCGTGNWPIDFAKEYSQAEVVGFDINTHAGWKNAPENCWFKAADLELEEAWSDLGQFDYIHSRHIAPACRNWPLLLKRCFEHLSPGGVLELQDFRYPLVVVGGEDAADCKLLEWSRYMTAATRRNGLDFMIMDLYPALLKYAGFVDVQFDHFKMCVGPWPEDEEDRELGRQHRENFCVGLPNFSRFLFPKELGWTEAEHDSFLREVIEEMRSGRYQSYFPLKSCFARRSE